AAEVPYALNDDDRICRNNRRSFFRMFGRHLYGTCLTSSGGKEENAMQCQREHAFLSSRALVEGPRHETFTVTQRDPSTLLGMTDGSTSNTRRAHRLSSRRARRSRLTIISAFSFGPEEDPDGCASRTS